MSLNSNQLGPFNHIYKTAGTEISQPFTGYKRKHFERLPTNTSPKVAKNSKKKPPPKVRKIPKKIPQKTETKKTSPQKTKTKKTSKAVIKKSQPAKKGSAGKKRGKKRNILD